jgi:hypothetical protein
VSEHIVPRAIDALLVAAIFAGKTLVVLWSVPPLV